MSAIVAKNLVKHFYNQPVLDDLNLTVKEGDIYGLVGLNGIGKTTLIRLLLSISKPNDGEIYIFGNEIAGLKKTRNKDKTNVRKKICYLPEKFTPSPELTGREVVEILSRFHRNNISANELKQWCNKFQFEKVDLDKKIKNYSKGMIQKIGLISTFITKSKLYILDEPMSGLDFKARNVLKEEILQLCEKQKATIFFTSHIMSDIDQLSNRVGVLHNGKLAFEGSISTLRKKSKDIEKAVLKVVD